MHAASVSRAFQRIRIDARTSHGWSGERYVIAWRSYAGAASVDFLLGPSLVRNGVVDQ